MRAGTRLLARRTIDAIPVDEIVDAAGVAKGSFFNHFSDKDAFAATIAAEIRADVEARVTAANEGVSDPAQRVARAVCGFIQFALTEPDRARIMLRGHEWAADSDHHLNRGITADIRSGLASNRFCAATREAGVLFVVGVCQMMLVAVVARRARIADIQSRARTLLTLTVTGLGLSEDEAAAIAARAVAEIVVGRSRTAG
jgi:AcrR family transcriptional regulator